MLKMEKIESSYNRSLRINKKFPLNYVMYNTNHNNNNQSKLSNDIKYKNMYLHGHISISDNRHNKNV